MTVVVLQFPKFSQTIQIRGVGRVAVLQHVRPDISAIRIERLLSANLPPRTLVEKLHEVPISVNGVSVQGRPHLTRLYAIRDDHPAGSASNPARKPRPALKSAFQNSEAAILIKICHREGSLLQKGKPAQRRSVLPHCPKTLRAGYTLTAFLEAWPAGRSIRRLQVLTADPRIRSAGLSGPCGRDIVDNRESLSREQAAISARTTGRSNDLPQAAFSFRSLFSSQ